MPDPIIVRAYPCLHPAERNACRFLATSLEGLGYRDLDSVYTRFINNLPAPQVEKRVQAWLTHYNLHLEEIGDPEDRIVVVPADQLWCTELNDCVQLGDCPAPPAPCLTFVWDAPAGS